MIQSMGLNNIKKKQIRTLFLYWIFCTCFVHAQAQNKDIYRGGWIDFNKNGKMDIYEDPRADIDSRVEDLLSQMNVNEKTAQCATLYGYKRVLKDELQMAL